MRILNNEILNQIHKKAYNCMLFLYLSTYYLLLYEHLNQMLMHAINR